MFAVKLVKPQMYGSREQYWSSIGWKTKKISEIKLVNAGMLHQHVRCATNPASGLRV